MKCTYLAAFVLLIGLAGCGKPAEEKKLVPLVDQPRPSSSIEAIVEDMAGKTDVKAGQRARKTIEKVSAQEKQDLEEVMN